MTYKPHETIDSIKEMRTTFQDLHFYNTEVDTLNI